MKKTLGLMLVLGLAAAPALAQKVTIDYAHDFDFGAVKTFQYVETKDSNSSNPLNDARIKEAIFSALTDGGLTQVESDPDLVLTYHLTSQENTVYTTSSFGYGGSYGSGWGGYGRYGSYGSYGGSMGSSTTTSSTFTEGTLIIDAYEPSGDKDMVWRGTGTVTVKSKPEKQAKQITAIVAKLGDKWHKILRGKKK